MIRFNRIMFRINKFQREFRIYFLIIFLAYVILDLLNIFPYGIGRIPIEPESSIPGIKYLYAIGFSYIFAIVMSIFTPKRTILWILAFPPIALIYKIIKKISKYYK
uniref:Uncharacterized protein n=1 Tax=uncultured marine thaumarchaeote AD1000_11_E10 TaxID=1455890 RepID=A0A075FJ18_9ARCH|nr:hypothetical protein [uncultured marine thaumarchaeote AD1000_11_E10]